MPRLDSGSHVVTDRYVPSSLVLQALDGLDLPEIWSYNRYVMPAITFYLEEDPEVIAGRLAARESLTRLEQVGNPRQELELYRRAMAFLGGETWRQHVIDCQGKNPEQVVAGIVDLLDTDNRGQPIE
nr:hypothetical protein [Allorhizocola rhizosphaerae]